MLDHFPDEAKTRDGIKMPLFSPDGRVSKDWLMVRWLCDDQVQAALSEVKRKGQDLLVRISPALSKAEKKKAEKKRPKQKPQILSPWYTERRPMQAQSILADQC